MSLYVPTASPPIPLPLSDAISFTLPLTSHPTTFLLSISLRLTSPPSLLPVRLDALLLPLRPSLPLQQIPPSHLSDSIARVCL
eukprot:CAMPEP_0181301738 /NCGR_PEP_ID=MMETSP1101-20121128/7591_1 /TAXON_ID=46948 /ORGANISM="Rhodomonas abbreviata, Strain Caron Lab Isolate" /LENGTH=82 /DNA_ID=CAMNT_0023407077 /DNA_START=182 /DNA_END=427 /DNA_ORIENTATION=-